MGTCQTDETKRTETCVFATNSADQAAKKAVKDVFYLLGVDVTDPVQVKEFQEDLRFGGKVRKAAEKGFVPFIILVLGMIGTAFIVGIKYGIKGG
jgi:hypothetical protein